MSSTESSFFKVQMQRG